MKSKTWLTAFAFALAGCGSSGIPDDGFKDIKYGMTLEQLQRQGFTCRRDEGECRRSGGARQETLFGQPAIVSVETRGGHVVRIEARVPMSLGDTLSLLRRNFGTPRRFERDEGDGQRTGIYVWRAANGTSISVPDDGSGTSVVQFNDTVETRQIWIVQGSGSRVDPTDI